MNNLTSIDIDDIVNSNIDDLVEILKLNSTIYIGNNKTQNIAIAKICAAISRIAYKKGYKKGKSVGSHNAYRYFAKGTRFGE